MSENSKQQVPFNTILFSDERILTEHEKQTILEYVIQTFLLNNLIIKPFLEIKILRRLIPIKHQIEINPLTFVGFIILLKKYLIIYISSQAPNNIRSSNT